MGTGIEVRDLASLNGTYVNETRVTEPVVMAAGDRLAIGSVVVEFTAAGVLNERTYRGNITLEARAACIPGIFAPVSLTIFPSELIAIMGPSGAGKTTLLEACNGYRETSGLILINGRDLYRHYDAIRSQIGYVPQDDIMHPQLTVREALYYTARLRTDLGDSEISDLIDRTLARLEILDCRDRIIGSAERKVISGGQRKRVNIAMELMSRPPLMFLDEPTSGLSSEDAENVVKLLKELTTGGSTVITTIHQPSLAVFRQFDGLIVMARQQPNPGRMVYFGPAFPDSVDFFDSAAARNRESGREGGAELVFKALAANGDAGRVGDSAANWEEKYQRSPYKSRYVDERSGKLQQSNGEPAPVQKPTRLFNFKQFVALTSRTIRIRLRDRAQTWLLMAQAPIFALVLILVYHHMEDTPGQADFESWRRLVGKVVGTHFMMTVAAVWFGCNNACREIVGEWAVYRRERMIGLQLFSYIGSKLLVLSALCTIQCGLLLLLVCAFATIKGNLAIIYGNLLLASMVGSAIGLFVSACARTTEAAVACLPIILLPMILVGGGMKPLHEMDPGAQHLGALMPTRWAFEANLKTEAENRVARFVPVLPPGAGGPFSGPAAPVDPDDVASTHFREKKERADWRTILRISQWNGRILDCDVGGSTQIPGHSLGSPGARRVTAIEL